MILYPCMPYPAPLDICAPRAVRALGHVQYKGIREGIFELQILAGMRKIRGRRARRESREEN